jgi:ABC-type oligopeptide transport system substrate-binding subunit
MPLNDDFHWPVDYNGRLVAGAIVGSLFVEDEIMGSPRPYRAASTICLEGGRRWQVQISDTYWSDGVRLSVDHLRMAVERILTRPNRVVARHFFPTRTEDQRQAVRILDEKTIEYRFARPIRFVPHLLTMPQFAPCRGSDSEASAPALGPYRLAKRERYGFVLHQNQRAARSRSKFVGRLVFRQFSDTESALAAYKKGTVDVTPTTSFGKDEMRAFVEHPNLLSRNVSMFGYLEFGASLPAFRKSHRLRAALGALIDRHELADRLPGLIRPLWDQSVFNRPEQKAVSKHLITDANRSTSRPDACITSEMVDALREGCRGSLEIAYANFIPNADVVGEICAQLRSRLGVEVRKSSLTYHEYVKAAITGDHCLLYSLTAADFTHPAAIFSPWRSDGSLATGMGFGDPALDRRIEAAESCADPSEEPKLWRDVSDIWLDLMPRIPILQVRANCLFSSRINDLHLTPGGLIPFDHYHHDTGLKSRRKPHRLQERK